MLDIVIGLWQGDMVAVDEAADRLREGDEKE